jgi:hypothetical protein
VHKGHVLERETALGEALDRELHDENDSCVCGGRESERECWETAHTTLCLVLRFLTTIILAYVAVFNLSVRLLIYTHIDYASQQNTETN